MTQEKKSCLTLTSVWNTLSNDNGIHCPITIGQIVKWLFDEFYSETMHKAIEDQQKNPRELEEFIAKIKVLKNFERIGDYATKIAKIVYYIAEGSNSPDF